MMRPRHMAVVLALGALPAGLAVAVTGDPNTSFDTTSTVVSIDLVAGGSAGSVRACGIVHHYKVYSSSSTISFRGLVSPAGQAKIKVKLKACSAGIFEPSGEAAAAEQPHGLYRGSFPAPIAGYYYARAEVKQSGATVARSAKSYFEVR